MKLNYSVEELSLILEAEIVGKCNSNIVDIKPIETAGLGELTFYYHDKYENLFKNSIASCIIVKSDITDVPKENQVFLKVENPYNKFVQLLKIITNNLENNRNGIHKSAVLGENCIIGNNVMISANCTIGNNCKISENVKLMPGVVLYDNVSIGKDSFIHSNANIYSDVVIGSNCIIHAGAVIGSDGFGYIENKIDGSYDKIPQLGNVVLEDFVEIGANSTIDCALVGSTIIRKGTKIDNLVHIAHNCEIGENTGIAAQAGISGSVNSGKRVRLGGQVGIAGHLEISDDVTILAQSGVSKSVTKSGIYFGSPIKDHFKAFKIEAVIRRLPELSYEVEKLKNDIKEINSKIGE
jgi:UDP-3-O-[3-hydroxymyristoyl] glucosamine N-acyltransferase